MKGKYVKIIVAITSCLLSKAYAQNISVSDKEEFLYNDAHSYVSMALMKNGQFIYKMSQHMLRDSIIGNWQIRGSNLILDSHPQKDKLIVYEYYQKAVKEKKIFIFDKLNNPIIYWLYTITFDNDTILSKRDFGYSNVRKDIKSFFLLNTAGLLSPTYTIKGSRSNVFKVLFETQRVFESESWKIEDDKITPLTPNGKSATYSLTKTQN